MDVKRNETFLPIVILTEDLEKIALMKAALRACTRDHERSLRILQRRVKDGQRQIDICTQKSNAIDLQLNVVETNLAKALILTQETEIETLRTVKENRNIKRKIIALKNDIEEQEKILQRAKETMQTVRTSCIRRSKKLKVLPDILT